MGGFWVVGGVRVYREAWYRVLNRGGIKTRANKLIFQITTQFENRCEKAIEVKVP